MNLVKLKLIPTDLLIPHESTTQKIEVIMNNIAHVKQLNHPIQAFQYKEKYVILDGHHRFMALKKLQMKYIPVQIVDLNQLTLCYWYHVTDYDFNNLSMLNGEKGEKLGTVCVNGKKGSIECRLNDMHDFIWRIFNRYSKSDFSSAYKADTNNWILFDGLKLGLILELAYNGKLLPPSLTRFVINYRILNLNVPLAILNNEDSEYWRLLCKLVSSGRVYEEPTINIEYHN